MAELFIELFSEEIPAKLQIDARQKIKKIIEENFTRRDIKFNLSKSFSTPKRLVFFINGIPETKVEKEKVIKGPKVDNNKVALEGFLKKNNLTNASVYKKNTEKGEFYFAKIKPKKIKILDQLQTIIPEAIQSYSWKKSMKWSNYELSWARPLKSIIALFNGKVIKFNLQHLISNNMLLLEAENETKSHKVISYNSYLNLLKRENIILDQEKRKNIILKKMKAICKSQNLKDNFDEKLLEEVVNLVDKPNVILGKFKDVYLKIPKEILIITMKKHQKYFPLFDNNNNKLTNLFLLVSNLPDKKGYIKDGNQRVIEARLSDAKFFWEKNKNQNLIKQVSRLKSLYFFNELGTFYDRTQRLRKLAGLISDQLNLNKEKIEIAASICKADLVSDLVGEYPELQGIVGKYFALEQGFDDDISSAISEHYMPLGLNSDVPKKNTGMSIAIIDKIDLLVGFFGINQKPTSSKDPFALRRAAIGLLRIIIEKKLNIKIKELINHSIIIYKEQKVNFSNDLVVKDILLFLRERFKNLLKDKKIRNDIIEAADSTNFDSDFLKSYKKCIILHKNISKVLGKNIINSYKRAFNIINQESTNLKENILGQPESFLFKQDEEKILFEKINEIRQYFSDTKKFENYEETLKILSAAKPITDNFFDNVIVDDNNLDIKKNRLELLQMFCKTYDNFIDFSKVEGI